MHMVARMLLLGTLTLLSFSLLDSPSAAKPDLPWEIPSWQLTNRLPGT